MHEEPFAFIRIRLHTDSVDRVHQFPKGAQRFHLLGFPELAEPKNVDKDAPPHQSHLRLRTLGQMQHALFPETNVARTRQTARGRRSGNGAAKQGLRIA